jgi:hypothetical protein
MCMLACIFIMFVAVFSLGKREREKRLKMDW